MKIAYLIISYNRIAQTKAHMELIKNCLFTQPSEMDVDIYHAYNGDESAYPRPYLERELYRRKNLGLFKGSCDLINTGISNILNSKTKYEYIIVSSGDVWFINPKLIKDSIGTLAKTNKQICTSHWYWAGYATEFFIIENDLAKKVFPLNLEYYEKKQPIQYLLYKIIRQSKLIEYPLLEILFKIEVDKNINNANSVLFFEGMSRISLFNRYFRPKVKYYSPHSNRNIKKVIQMENLTRFGAMFRELLDK